MLTVALGRRDFYWGSTKRNDVIHRAQLTQSNAETISNLERKPKRVITRVTSVQMIFRVAEQRAEGRQQKKLRAQEVSFLGFQNWVRGHGVGSIWFFRIGRREKFAFVFSMRLAGLSASADRAGSTACQFYKLIGLAPGTNSPMVGMSACTGEMTTLA